MVQNEAGSETVLITASIKRFTGMASLVVAYRAAGVVLGLLAQLILARTLAADALGTFFMATSLAAVFGILASVGYPMIVPKYLAGSRGAGQRTHPLTFLHAARGDIIVVSGLICLFGFAVLYVSNVRDEAVEIALAIGVLSIPFLALLRFNGATANAMKRFSLGFFPDLTLRPALLTGLLLVFWWSGRPLSLHDTLFAFLLIAGIIAVWQQATLLRVEHAIIGTMADSDDAPASMARKEGAAMLIGMLFLAAAADVAIFIASWFLASADLAIFGVCLKISMICGFAVNAVQQIAVRDLGDALSQEGRGTVSQVLSLTNGLSIAFALAGLVFVVAFGHMVLALFGETYVTGYSCLIIMMSVNLMRALAGPSLHLVSMVDAERVSPLVFLTTLIGLSVLMAVLAPAYGILGAALAFFAAMAAWPFWLSLIVWKKAGIASTVLFR